MKHLPLPLSLVLVLCLACACGGSGGGGPLDQGDLVSGFGFGVDGVVTTNPSPGTDRILAIDVDADAIYVGGWDAIPGPLRWRIEKRSQLDGSLVGDFGVGGVVVEDFGPGTETLTGILVTGGAVYVCGNDGQNIRIQKRNAVSGALDPAFGVGGTITEDPSAWYDTMSSFATDGAALYVGGRDQSAGHGDWSLRIEKRSLVDGSLIPGFGVGGVLHSNPSPNYDGCYDLVVDDGSLYITGTDETVGAGDRSFRIEKRSAATGALIPAFGVGGVISQDLGPGLEQFYELVVADGWVFLAGDDQVGGERRWHVQKRDSITGALEPGFGIGGSIVLDPQPGVEYAYDLVVRGPYLFVGGVAPEGQWRLEKRMK